MQPWVKILIDWYIGETNEFAIIWLFKILGIMSSANYENLDKEWLLC